MTPPIITNSSGLPEGNTDDPVLIAHPRGGIPTVIETTEELREAIAALQTSSMPTAIDVERAHGFKYSTAPYLLQLRKEDVGTFLIDTELLSNLSELSPAIKGTWILHSAHQDLPNLRSLKLSTTSLFDTEVAARLIGVERFGLASICEQILGLSLIKDHQAANWSVRPLPKDWLRYAALDVELLTELQQRLSTRLDELGRSKWAAQEFAYLLRKPAPAPKQHRWRDLPGVSKIRDRRQLGVVKALWEKREEIAQAEDISPSRVIHNAALIAAATKTPRNRRNLLAIGDFRSPGARRYADAWLRSIHLALVANPDELPELQRPIDPHAIPEARLWAKRDPEAHQRLHAVRTCVGTIAQSLGIAPEVLLTPKDQRYITWAPFEKGRDLSEAVDVRIKESEARPWQQELVGDAITSALAALQ